MKKLIGNVLLLLIFTSYLSAAPAPGTESDMVDAINKNVLEKVSNITDIVKTLPILPNNSTSIESSRLLSRFKNLFLRNSAKYKENPAFYALQFLLFTPSQPNNSYDLKLSEESLQNSTFNSGLDLKFLIHDIIDNLPESSVYFKIKDSLLKQGKYNVIVVDWTKYNKFGYPRSCATVPFVGFEIGKLIQLLIESSKISANSVHLIGRGLGAQVAGYTAKVVDNLGRITGLDAADRPFPDLPESLRLCYKDANFVDALLLTPDIFAMCDAYLLQDNCDCPKNTSLENGFKDCQGFYDGHIVIFPNGGSSQSKFSLDFLGRLVGINITDIEKCYPVCWPYRSMPPSRNCDSAPDYFAMCDAYLLQDNCDCPKNTSLENRFKDCQAMPDIEKCYLICTPFFSYHELLDSMESRPPNIRICDYGDCSIFGNFVLAWALWRGPCKGRNCCSGSDCKFLMGCVLR